MKSKSPDSTMQSKNASEGDDTSSNCCKSEDDNSLTHWIQEDPSHPQGKYVVIGSKNKQYDRLTKVGSACFDEWDKGDYKNFPKLRFRVGDPVFCQIGGTWWSNHSKPGYRLGRVIKTWYHENEWPKDRFAPYQVALLVDFELKVNGSPLMYDRDTGAAWEKEFFKSKGHFSEGGATIFAPCDDDRCIMSAQGDRPTGMPETTGLSEFSAKQLTEHQTKTLAVEFFHHLAHPEKLQTLFKEGEIMNDNDKKMMETAPREGKRQVDTFMQTLFNYNNRAIDLIYDPEHEEEEDYQHIYYTIAMLLEKGSAFHAGKSGNIWRTGRWNRSTTFQRVMADHKNFDCPASTLLLSHIYEFGLLGQKKNATLATKYLQHAADLFMPEAMMRFASNMVETCYGDKDKCIEGLKIAEAAMQTGYLANACLTCYDMAKTRLRDTNCDFDSIANDNCPMLRAVAVVTCKYAEQEEAVAKLKVERRKKLMCHNPACTFVSQNEGRDLGKCPKCR